MVAHSVSCAYNRRTTSLLPFSSMPNLSRWLKAVPQPETGSQPGPQTPRQLGRPRSASCSVDPPPRAPSTVPEHSSNDTRSTESRTTHESNKTIIPSPTDPLSLLTLSSLISWLARYPSYSGSSSSSSSSSDDSNNNPRHRPSSDPFAPHQPAHLLQLSGWGDDQPYRDFRSPWLAWQRERSEKEKYYGFRYVNRGQLIAARQTAMPPQPPILYMLAQAPPRPPKTHHRPAHKVYVESSQPAGKVYGKPSQRVDRRRKEQKHRKAILKAELEDFRLKTWPRERR
jgi:hypothetical protein